MEIALKIKILITTTIVLVASGSLGWFLGSFIPVSVSAGYFVSGMVCYAFIVLGTIPSIWISNILEDREIDKQKMYGEKR